MVVTGNTLQSPLPDAVADDRQMDQWLSTVQPLPQQGGDSSEYCVHLLPEGRKGAFRVEDGGRRLTMGTGMTGWLLVSPDASRMTHSLQGLPKMLAAVLVSNICIHHTYCTQSILCQSVGLSSKVQGWAKVYGTASL